MNMKLGFCLMAFFMGCVTTVFLPTHAPDEAVANHSSGLDQSNPGLVAEVLEPKSGRKMELLTNQSCLHLESGTEFDGQPASGGLEARQGFQLTPWSCLEATQPITHALRMDETPFQDTTIYRFSLQP